jgi:hypothetical protein
MRRLVALSSTIRTVLPCSADWMPVTSRGFERAVVPVIDHKCLGCSMAVPTAKRKSGEDRTTRSVVVCESCGRILFFV